MIVRRGFLLTTRLQQGRAQCWSVTSSHTETELAEAPRRATTNADQPPGTLLTFVQFLFIATTGYISQFDRNNPPFFVRPNKVPIRRWLFNIALFFSINMLNNWAFSFDISVPVHIILRSGGSIVTMFAGWLVGKKYSRMQFLAVMLLTMGVILAAWSDAQSKVPLTHSS